MADQSYDEIKSDPGTSVNDLAGEIAESLLNAPSEEDQPNQGDPQSGQDQPEESGQEPKSPDSTATEDDEADSSKASEAGEPEERQELKTLDDLAKAIGVEDPQGLYNLELSFKAAGQDTKATLQDLVGSYQFQSHLTQRSQELAKAKADAATAQQEYLQRAESKVKELDDTVIAVQSFINQNPPDQRLRSENPEAYLAQLEQWNNAQQVIGQAFAQRQSVVEEAEKAQAEAKQRLLEEQRAKLNEYIPEWSEPARQQSEVQQLSQYLLSNDYLPSEVKGVVDARAVRIARKAMLYDQLKAQTPTVMAKVNKAAQQSVQKPGAETPEPSTHKADGLLSKALRTKDLKDFGEVFAAEYERTSR